MTANGHIPSVLQRFSSADLRLPSSSSPLQNQVDGLVSRFVEEASSPTTLAALSAGGLAYRFGRIGVLALGTERVAALPLRFLSVGVGLGSEVTAFEFTNRTFQSVYRSPITGHRSPNLWSWSGPGGWREGLAFSALSFGLLKGGGYLAREENIVLQHLFQSGAMVSGHQLGATLGLVPRPEGSLAERFLEAERTNLSMGAGAALLHAAFPRMAALERSLDLNLHSLQSGIRGHNIMAGPSFALATGGNRDFTSSSRPSSLDFLTGPHQSHMSSLGERLGSRGTQGPSPEIINRLTSLLEGEPATADLDLESVARHFSTEPEVFKPWIQGFCSVLASVGRSQSKEQSVQDVFEVLSFYQDKPQILNRLLNFFLYTANEYQAPHRALQNFSEAIEAGLGAVRFYERLGVSMNAAKPMPLAREPLGDGYFLQISPGEGEAAGGLHFTLIREEGHLLLEGGTPLAEIGLMVGLDKAQVVFVQGEKGHYSSHVNRLKRLLGKDPFDWLLEGAADWARSEGLQSFQAYSHTHNYWLRNRLKRMGNTLEFQGYLFHLMRLYDERFLRLGLRPHPEIEGLFEKTLSAENSPASPTDPSSVTLRVMNRILRPLEEASTISASSSPEISAAILGHLSRSIDQAMQSPHASFDRPTLEKSRELLLAGLQDPATRVVIQEHLFDLEESYPPGFITDYIFAIGSYSQRGKTLDQALEILSSRLAEGNERQTFYRGLGRIELMIWNLGHQVVSRRPNGEKVPEIERIAEELRQSRGYPDLSKKVDGFLEELKKENPDAIRVSEPTFLKMIDLFREQSMEHLFFSRSPAEAAGDFARIGGILLRMTLPERLVPMMNPLKGRHVAFPKTSQNLAWLIRRYRPDQLYFGREGLDQAVAEAESLPDAPSKKSRWPAVEAPFYIPHPVVTFLEAAMEHPPARHVLNQIVLRKSMDRIFQSYRDGKGDSFEGEIQNLGFEPKQAFEFLKEYGQKGVQ